MKQSRRSAKKILALLLVFLLLFGASPLLLAANALEPETAATDTQAQPDALAVLRKAASAQEPYILPPEAENAKQAKLSLLQNGSLEAKHPGISLFPQSESGAAAAFAAMVENLEVSADFSQHAVTYQQLETIANNLINTRPELFYFQGFFYTESGGVVKEVWVWYSASISVIQAQKALLDQLLSYTLAQVPSGLSDLEKTLWVHEFLTANTAYAPGNEAGWSRNVYTVYGVFAENIAVCQGYALAYMLLMEELGVSCIFVPSVPMNHAWNLVRLDGAWYHVDATWDDPSLETVANGAGYNGGNLGSARAYSSHRFLLLSDMTIGSSAYDAQPHKGWVSVYDATSTKYENYFWKKTSSAIVPFGGAWYYIEDNSSWSVGSGMSISYRLQKTDFATGLTESFATLGASVASLPASTSYFINTRFTPSLAVLGDRLYFSNGKAIYSIAVASHGTPQLELSEALNEASYQSIAGFSIRLGVLVYDVLNAGGNVLRFTQKTKQLDTPPALVTPGGFAIEAPEAILMYYRDRIRLTATEPVVRWESDAPGVVKVDQNGNLQNFFGVDGVGAVYAYNAAGECAQIIVVTQTQVYQYLIWYLLFGWIWYRY
ncbi:MAG: hypothetical protein LBQ33_04105 [Oscillospiraceae bacterium]|jgi:hypothetical protein|nr:hypothetical protein [Oscillospiraceae bacterium]